VEEEDGENFVLCDAEGSSDEGEKGKEKPE
jgi:hypothetical protein